MQTLNRAIEGASDFREMMRKLQAVNDDRRTEVQAIANRAASPKRPGENREQYRARLHALSKVKV